MSATTLNAGQIAKMFLAGAYHLDAQKEWINELNVFPVPDGDTGTNMTMTIMSAAREVASLPEDVQMDRICSAIASGSLRGARGNSGVILSQLLTGFTKVVRDYEEVDAPILAQAFNRGVETAYKAVMKPKEGTILTVARGMAEKASETCDQAEDIESFAKGVIEYGDEVLAQTPEMLKELKQAGVVDSGGQGLMQVLKGAYECLMGREIDFAAIAEKTSAASSAPAVSVEDEEEIKFGYCTEFIIMLDKVFNSKNEIDFKSFLESIGDSIVCVAADDIVKVHVHTNDPGLAIQRALKYGQLTNLKIDNMRQEHHERVLRAEELKAAGVKVLSSDDSDEAAVVENAAEDTPRKDYGFLAVSVGDGLDEIFRDLGVDYIIPGGQTMNPSTDDMMNAIDKVNADVIYIFPNNKNIIMAANQARDLTEDKKIIVIPTKTVPQGITAMISFAADASPEENEALMTEEIGNVRTGQVTFAVRDTVIDDKEIHEGNIMGIGDKTILSVGTNVEDTTREMIDAMTDEDSALISIYYGKEVDEEIAEAMGKEIEAAYPDLDVEVHAGGQPVYYYIVSVE